MVLALAETSTDGTHGEAGSWGSIGLIYIYSILAAISITKLNPLTADLERVFAATPKGIGFAISLTSVCSLVAATIGGVIIDRVGARPAIIVTSIIAVISNIIAFFAKSMLMLDVARLIEGLEFIGIITAAPALLMSITSGARRTKAMSLWSTYIPVGCGLGFLLGGFFAGAHWRWIFLLHGGLFAIAACFGGLLPKRRPTPSSNATSRFAELWSIYREVGPMRLSLAYLWISVLAIGTGAVLPRYLAQTHHVSIAAASSMLALASCSAWIVAGIIAGLLLARNWSTSLLYLVLTLVGAVSGFLMLAPWVSFLMVAALFFVWGLANGAGVAVIMSLLPQVVRDTRLGGAASGLMLQVMSVGALFTPPIFLSVLAKGNWTYLAIIVVACWVLSLVCLPAGRKAPLNRQAAASLH